MLGELLEQYPKYHHLVASTQLVLAMVGMGAVMRLQDFVEIVREPRPILTGALYQLVGIPLLTLGLTRAFDLPPEIAVGFFLLAALPGGSMSNVYTYLGKGNTALSIALTGLLTLTALVTAPLILRWFAADILPPEIPMPAGTIIREIALYLLLPLGVGMALGKGTRHGIILSKWAVRASLVVLTVLVVGSLGSGRIELGAYGPGILFLVIGYCIGIQVIIQAITRRILRFPPRDITTLAIESSMKNINLGLLIAASLFALEGPSAEFGAGVLFVLLLYGGASLLVSAGPALGNLRHESKQQRAPDA